MGNVYLCALLATERLRFCENVKRIRKCFSKLKNNRALVREIEVQQSSVNDGETTKTRITFLRENFERFVLY